jgi:type II secretory pathway pseudopilin PulG
MRDSFTVLELLFSIVIISILSSLVITNIFPIVKDANIIKAKTNISNIRLGIYNYYDNNGTSYPITLDIANTDTKAEILFSTVLTYPLISTDDIEKKSISFVKKSDTLYKLYINNESIEFVYDNQKGVFDCDYDIELCQKINR